MIERFHDISAFKYRNALLQNNIYHRLWKYFHYWALHKCMLLRGDLPHTKHIEHNWLVQELILHPFLLNTSICRKTSSSFLPNMSWKTDCVSYIHACICSSTFLPYLKSVNIYIHEELKKLSSEYDSTIITNNEITCDN